MVVKCGAGVAWTGHNIKHLHQSHRNTAYLRPRKVESQHIYDVLQVTVDDVTGVRLVEVNKREEKIGVNCHHLLLLFLLSPLSVFLVFLLLPIFALLLVVFLLTLSGLGTDDFILRILVILTMKGFKVYYKMSGILQDQYIDISMLSLNTK